jgi:hypothetical protein
MPFARVGWLICAKNATGAMPVPRKLWLISERAAGVKGSRRAVSVRVNFVLRPCVFSEEEWGLFRKFGAGPLSADSVSRD